MKIETQTFTMSQFNERVKLSLSVNLPVLVIGLPGIGKSQWAESFANDNNMQVIVEHPSMQLPTDVKGLPANNNGNAEFLPYGFMKSMIDANTDTLVLVEDLIQASPTMQAAWMQVIHGRNINGKQISDKVKFIITSNRASDKAGGMSIIEPFKSRCFIAQYPSDVNNWIQWGIESKRIAPEILFFVKNHQNLFHDFTPSKDIKNYPCPRTWEIASRFVNAGFHDLPTLIGCIGESAASTLAGFLANIKKIGGIWGEIERNPNTARLLEELDNIYAMGLVIASNVDKKTFSKVSEYLKRYNNNELYAFVVEMACNLHPELRETQTFIKYKTSN